jgi:hypothetical protein
MTKAIQIKPHHFVDILRALGEDRAEFKPHRYGHNLHFIASEILADDEVLLQIELGADDICKPCIHNADGRCDDVIDTSFRPQAPRLKDDWNRLIDERWCRALGLAPGSRLTARQFCERLRQHVSDMVEIYHEVPAERTAVRAENVRRGIAKYLG